MVIVQRRPAAQKAPGLVLVEDDLPLPPVGVSGEGAPVLSPNPSLDHGPFGLHRVGRETSRIGNLAGAVVHDLMLEGAGCEAALFAHRLEGGHRRCPLVRDEDVTGGQVQHADVVQHLLVPARLAVVRVLGVLEDAEHEMRPGLALEHSAPQPQLVPLRPRELAQLARLALVEAGLVGDEHALCGIFLFTC